MTNKELSLKLKKYNISPSIQRVEIYKYLWMKRNHPTVDMIYKDLVENIPSLSKTTVYNTLKLFVSNGLAIELTIDKNEVRYDAEMSIHGHFVDEDSNKIYDFDVNLDGINKDILSKAEINEHHIYFKGSLKK